MSLSLRTVGSAPLDILIIGGGIVGAGVARDAALRGLRVGLAEQADFASGTSSRSSRLLHGGIRYLAQGRVGLVREASVEKTILHTIAPHLAEPLAFIFPTYRGLGWPLWQLRIGVKIYDLLASGRNLGSSTSFGETATQERLPGLRALGLRGAVRYFDGFTNDARLVVDTLRSASAAGAHIANYLRHTSARYEGGLWHCALEDRITGEPLVLTARAVVNATGPWADLLPQSSVHLRLTKGIHCVVDRERFGFDDAVVITAGARILFVIPWGERTIVGTTDTDYSGPPEAVRVEEADIRYLLKAIREFFPSVSLEPGDLVSSWAGLRPLLADPHGNPSDISRSHEIRNPQPGWWDVAGGKLTTYRLMAEQAVSRIVHSARLTAGPCLTATTPLLPGSPAPATVPPPFSREAVEHACREEWARHIGDVMIRRTGWQHYHRAAAELARKVGLWMGELHGWSPMQATAEWARYEAEVS